MSENKNMNELENTTELDKKIEAMVEARIAEIMKKSNQHITGGKVKKTPKKPDSLEEYVDVELFYDGDKYKDDVFVQVNGENCVIKRGTKVRIKRKFALALEESHVQDIKTSRLKDKAQSEAKDLEKRNII